MERDNCFMCKAGDVELYGAENIPQKFCGDCREKMRTHIAIWCSGCDRVCWIPKDRDNLVISAHLSGLPVEHIKKNPMFHRFFRCRHCKGGEMDKIAKNIEYH